MKYYLKKKKFSFFTGVDFKTMNKDIEPSAFWRAKGVFIPHLVSIMDSNLIVYQESFQSVDNIISKIYNVFVCIYIFFKYIFINRFCTKKFAS